MENEGKENLPAGPENAGLQNTADEALKNLMLEGGEMDNAEKLEAPLPDAYSDIVPPVFETAKPEETDGAAEKYEDFLKQQEEAVALDKASLEEDMKEQSDLLAGGEKKNEFDAKASLENVKSILAENKNKTVIVMAALAFIVLGAVYFSWSGSGIKNEQASSVDGNVIIKSSLEEMKGVRSYSYDGKIGFTYSLQGDDSLYSSKGYSGGIEIGMKGVSDGSDSQNPASSGSLRYSLNLDNGSGTKNEIVFDMDAVSANKNQYLKINDFKATGDSSSAEITGLQDELEKIKGNWYLATDEEIKQFNSAVSNGAEIPVISGDQEELFKDFQELFSRYDILKFSQDLGTEKAGGVDAYHYKVNLDTKEAIELAVAMIEKSQQQNGGDEEAKNFLENVKNSTKDIDKAKQIVDYILNDVNVEMWVGKDDKLVHRFRVNGVFDQDSVKGLYEKISEVYGGDYSADKDTDTPKINLNFDIDLVFSGFNSSKVQEPQPAKSFQEIADIFKRLNAASSGSIIAGPSSSTVDSDSDGLTDDQENFYGTDIYKADTDGDGHSDGSEVKYGYDPLVPGSAKLDYSKLYKVR